MISSSITVIDYPLVALPTLYVWLNEFPNANLDDYGPRNYEDFEREMKARLLRGERLYGIKSSGVLVGAVGFVQVTNRLGIIHGVCFCRSSHGKGISSGALTQILDRLWNDGFEKVSASYFADNTVVRAFFKRLGFIDEGYMVAQTIRNGKPVDMRLVAKFKGDK